MYNRYNLFDKRNFIWFHCILNNKNYVGIARIMLFLLSRYLIIVSNWLLFRKIYQLIEITQSKGFINYEYCK